MAVQHCRSQWVAGKPTAACIAQLRPQLLHLHPRRYAPRGMKDNELHVGREDRRRRVGSADDNLLSEDDFSLVDDPGHLLGHAVPDIEVAQIVRHPPPSLHVGNEPANVACDHLASRAATGRRQRPLQTRKLVMLGMQSAQIAVDVIGIRDGEHHGPGVVHTRPLVEFATDGRRLQSAAPGLAGILEHGDAEFDLAVSDGLGAWR